VPGTTFIDVADSEIAGTRFPFDDINTAPWAQVARAATEIAASHGFGAGFFTGHQVPGKRGWIGIDVDPAERPRQRDRGQVERRVRVRSLLML
jgi:hypothetical protein